MTARRRTLRLVVAYDGTDFAGWQRQAHQRTVQGELEQVLAAIEGAPVQVAGAGRTDSGVHAAAQVASVRLVSEITPERLVRACNASLGSDLRVLEAEEMFEAFHARLHARGKTYRYFIWHGPAAHPALRGTTWHVPQRLSLTAMQAAAARFVGEHDFAAFQAHGSRVHTTIRRVWTSSVAHLDQLPAWVHASERERLLCLEVAGSGFLRYQVRAMAGSVVSVGLGRSSLADLDRALNEKRRALAGPTAPAHGLHLWQVHYESLEP